MNQLEIVENDLLGIVDNATQKMYEGSLPALCMYMKGEVSLDFLLCTYRKVLLTVAFDDIMLKSFFLDCRVKDAGLM